MSYRLLVRVALLVLLSVVAGGIGRAAVQDQVGDALALVGEATVDGVSVLAEGAEAVTTEAGDRLLATTVKSGPRVVSAATTLGGSSGSAGAGFFASDFTKHPSIEEALTHSLRPADAVTNVKASVRANLHPLALAGNVALPVILEARRELSEDGRIDPGTMVKEVKPAAIAGGVAGTVVADAAGAVVQSTLARCGGPVGPLAGFIARPMVTYAGYMIGSNFGKTAGEGRPSLRGAVAQSLRDVDPVRDVCSVAGANLGGVLGQAVIPVPVVGYIAGAVVGGVAGSFVGQALGHQGPTGSVNEGLQAWLRDRAREVERRAPPPRGGRDVYAMAPVEFRSADGWTPDRTLSLLAVGVDDAEGSSRLLP